jgi:glycosyltransferase involved in cell wall biosynthesis
MKVTVSIGPGQHDAQLVSALVSGGFDILAVRSWPELSAARHISGNDPVPRFRYSAYRHITRITWALSRRIGRVCAPPDPRTFLYTIADRLVRRRLESADLFVGWSQVSLNCLVKMKSLGVVTLLEHPMSHVDTWMTLVGEEFRRWGERESSQSSLFSKSLISRMKQEYQCADFIGVLSSFAKKSFLAAGIPESRIVQVPLGVDIEQFRPVAPRSGTFRVLVVGRLEFLKGIQYVLQAFSELRLPDAEIWLVGPVLPEVKALLARYDGPEVRVIGPIANGEIARYYQQADVLVFPSINDAFGLVILEGMASGLPVIATDHSGAPDVIENLVDGFVIPIRSVEAIKERLDWLYRHRDDAREMGCRARKKVADRFTWDHYGQHLNAAYDRILCPAPN